MICQKHLHTNWNYVCCQIILDHWIFHQEVLATIGALSNFCGVTVWARGLWQELLRGRESIRQGSLQSGQLLKMQQHHYSLTQPTTSVSFTASLFISLWITISVFFFFLWILFASTICSPFDISHSTQNLSILFSLPPPHIFYYQTGRGEPLSPLCACADPLKLFHSYST